MEISLTRCLCIAGVALVAWSSQASAETRSSTTAACTQLADLRLDALAEAPTQIISAQVISGVKSVPTICRIKGYVRPNVGFELSLPVDDWNDKFIQLGSGSHGGSLNSAKCGDVLRRGYACIVSDLGHQGAPGMDDAVWAQNNLQAKIDWGYRAAHVVTVAGKAITARFYSRNIRHAYFMGCSTGGREALQEAQRFPWDYDGIIAGAPPIRLADLYVTFAWGQRSARAADGSALLGVPELKLLTEAALRQCDTMDGLKDGIIGNPARCAFRPRALLCKSEPKTGHCLSEAQVEAAEKIYAGPTDSKGKSLFGAGAAPGSEIGTPPEEANGGNWGTYYTGNGRKPAGIANLTWNGLKYIFRDTDLGPNWSLANLDFDEDYKRLDVMQSIYDSSNPDLTRFRAAGGKLLIYQGLNDLSILPVWVSNYYEKVEAVMGGPEKTRAFARLFQLPGVEHCGGGPGADDVDYLSYMERWVEQGDAPEIMLAKHFDVDQFLKTHDINSPDIWAEYSEFRNDAHNIKFTRPVYPYPLLARYKGVGDPNVAASFRAETR